MQVSLEPEENVFAPKFIPLYWEIQEEYSLTIVETALFGFVEFYLNKANEKFYFTNQQLAKILHTTPKTISRSFSTLIEKNLILADYKIKQDGGKIRFIKLMKDFNPDYNEMLRPMGKNQSFRRDKKGMSDGTKSPSPTGQKGYVGLDKKGTSDWTKKHSPTGQKGYDNNNKENNNKLNNNKGNNNKYIQEELFSKNFLEQIANTYQVPMSFVESCLDDCLRYMESYGLEEKIVNKQAYFSSWVKRNKLEFLRKEKSNELRNNIKITRIS